MRHPTWFVNMVSVWTWNKMEPDEYLTALGYWCPRINRFIDETLIKDNKDAEALVRVCRRLFFRFMDWSKIRSKPEDSGTFRLLAQTAKRLKGIG